MKLLYPPRETKDTPPKDPYVLLSDTRDDCKALDAFHRAFEGKKIRIVNRTDQNPALMLFLQVVENDFDLVAADGDSIFLGEPDCFVIRANQDGKYWGGRDWVNHQHQSNGFSSILHARKFVNEMRAKKDPNFFIEHSTFSVTYIRI